MSQPNSRSNEDTPSSFPNLNFEEEDLANALKLLTKFRFEKFIDWQIEPVQRMRIKPPAGAPWTVVSVFAF